MAVWARIPVFADSPNSDSVLDKKLLRPSAAFLSQIYQIFANCEAANEHRLVSLHRGFVQVYIGLSHGRFELDSTPLDAIRGTFDKRRARSFFICRTVLKQIGTFSNISHLYTSNRRHKCIRDWLAESSSNLSCSIPHMLKRSFKLTSRGFFPRMQFIYSFSLLY